MNTGQTANGVADAFAVLKRFARSSAPAERCDLCGAVLDPVHPHLLERSQRRIVCACEACSILFCDHENGRYVRIPRGARLLPDFTFSDLEWEEMTIPINLAFFFRSGENRIIAMYPSPAGAIESQLTLPALESRFAAFPDLSSMKPEVEALLVNRIPKRESVCMIAPIDECFRLVGIIRSHWRGLSGGTEVWTAVAGFFDELEQKAAGARKGSHA